MPLRKKSENLSYVPRIYKTQIFTMTPNLNNDDVLVLPFTVWNLRPVCPRMKAFSKVWFIFLFGFYGISTFVGYLMPNLFYTNKQFYFKHFSLAKVYSLIVKNISISSYSVYSNSLFQTIQFRISIVFIYTQLKLLFPTIQLSITRVLMSK